MPSGKFSSVLVGTKFGFLTFIRRAKTRNREAVWVFECKCGVQKKILSKAVTGGHTKSCGRNNCQYALSLRSRHAANKRLTGEASCRTLFLNYQGSAKRRRIPFVLTESQFIHITKSNCVYCGIPPTSSIINGKKANGPYIYNGVDRVNNSVGYTSENCVACCKQCNFAKRSQSLSDFTTWILRLVKHRSQLNSENGE